MKKVLMVLFVFSTSLGVSAQGIDFGVKAGVNFANLSNAVNFEGRTGFVAGVFVGGKLNDNIGVQADLLYSQQGGEFEFNKFELNYVNVPIVIKYYVSNGFNLQLGPQFGILLDEDTNAVSEVIDNIATNDFDLSGVIGIGYDLPMGIRLDGRYNFGFTDVSKTVEGKNSVITLAIGYSFL